MLVDILVYVEQSGGFHIGFHIGLSWCPVIKLSSNPTIHGIHIRLSTWSLGSFDAPHAAAALGTQ